MFYTDAIINKINQRSQALHGKKLDAAQTANLQRELTQVLSQVLEVKYPDLKGRKFVPVRTDIERGAEFVVSKIMDDKGRAKILTSEDSRLPIISQEAAEEIRRVVQLGAAYTYSISEMEAAAFSGRSISADKAKAARRVMEREIDELIMKGTIGNGKITEFTGFVNNANVPQYIHNSALDSADGDVVLQALHDWVNSVNTQSKGVFSANRVVLSNYYFNKFSSTPYSTVVPETILSLFVKQTGIEVDYSLYCDDASYDGYAAGHDLGVAYFADPEVLTFGNPVPYEELPVQDTDLGFKVPVRASFSGTVFHQPLAASYGIFDKS